MTEYLYKVLVVGNNRVGKTAFLERYINNSFSAQYKTTLGGLNQTKLIRSHLNERFCSVSFSFSILLCEFWVATTMQIFIIWLTILVTYAINAWCVTHLLSIGGRHSYPSQIFIYEPSRFHTQNFSVDFQPKVIKYEYCTLRMQFWDIAGQDRVKVLTRNYYNGASACLIVFDITNSKSFEDVKEWKAEIDDKLGQIPTIVLANKVGECG